MERELPTIELMGSIFFVDVSKAELRQKDDPDNIISIFDMRDTGNGYEFEYSYNNKNTPELFETEGSVSILLPELVKLDPKGMAEKYNYPLDQVHLMNDFDLMVDQEAYQRRLMGILPIVEIDNHPFYVDIFMGKLRPHDDFASNGIEFSEIENHFIDELDAYQISYNPKTHEFEDVDLDSITEFPKHLIAVSFPHESVLDPIGYNRFHGWEDKTDLKKTNVQSHFTANIVPWEKSGLEITIKENNSRLGTKDCKNSNKPPKKRPKF